VEIIILSDGMYHLIPITKELLEGMVLVQKTDLFELCDILRLKLTTYWDYPYNRHVMNDGSGDFIGCIAKQN
jgi:hypothetical protein